MLAILTAVLLQGPSVAPPSGSQDDPIMVAPFDLSRVAGGNSGKLTAIMPMMPFWMGQRWWGLTNQKVQSPTFRESALMDLFTKVSNPKVWESGSSMTRFGDGVIVSAPRSAIRIIEKVLETLEEIEASSQELNVRAYVGSPPGGQGTTLLSVDEATRRLGPAIKDGSLVLARAIFSSASNSTPHIVNQRSESTQIFDWDVEIAQGATIGDPAVIGLTTGLRGLIRSFPVERGVLVDLMLQQSSLSDLRTLTQGAEAQLLSQGGVQSFRHIGVMQLPAVEFASFAGSAVIPTGKVLWIPTQVTTAYGSVEILIEIQPGPGSRVLTRVTDIPGPNSLLYVDVGATTCSRVSCPPLPPDAFAPYRFEHDEKLGWSFLSDGGTGLEDFLGILAATYPSLQEVPYWYDQGGKTLLLVPDDLAGQAESAFQALLDGHQSLVVEGSLRGETEIARFRLPMLQNRSASLWAGVQTLYLWDWDVDVANESQCSNPEIEPLLDGFALRFTASIADNQQQVKLGVEGKVNLLHERPRLIELGTDDNRSVELTSADTLALDESVWTTLGKPVRFGGANLTLELTVHKQ